MQIEIQCAFCVHLRGKGTCDAFPNGIPEDIFITGKHNHTEPFEGDNGIRFEKIENGE